MTENEAYTLEIFIAKFLRYGVLAAGVLMLVGWLSQINFAGDTFAAFRVYQETRLTEHLRVAIENRNIGLLISYAGLFLLILLPFSRVLMTFAVFVKKRDYILAAVSALVLLGLCLSFALGFEI